MPKSEAKPVEIPDGPITKREVIAGIRRMAYGETADTTRLRAWELLGRTIALFKDSPTDGGAPVVRLTPELSQRTGAAVRDEVEAGNDGE